MFYVETLNLGYMEKQQPDVDPDYELQEIILTLEAIKEYGSGTMNPWKAILCLAKEINQLKKEIEYGKVNQRFKSGKD